MKIKINRIAEKRKITRKAKRTSLYIEKPRDI